jgi:hypothetical protein
MWKTLAVILIAWALATPALAADAPSDRIYTITLGPRTACATPKTARQARAEGGSIDVTTPASNVLAMAMSGSVAANAFLGQTSTATETFHLEQEFEIACSDSATCFVRLTLESALVGFVRSKHKAGTSVKVASARICVPGSPESPFVIVHPAQAVEGDNGRLCNQHLPLIKVDKMPLGKYLLVADFVLSCDAGGVLDGHSAADFSPSTSLPADWVRTRDPFQGVDKKDFGFKLVLTADPPEGSKMPSMTAKGKDNRVTRTSTTTANLVSTRTMPTPTRPRPALTGLDRHCGPR